MSVIAWDGRTLAADRQGTWHGLKSTICKLVQIDATHVAAVAGRAACFAPLIEWARAGCHLEDAPFHCFERPRDDTPPGVLIVAGPEGVDLYEGAPYPQRVLDPFMAWGSGSDFAMGAMAMGADAVRAVEITSEHSVQCGKGVDFGVVGKPVAVNRTKLPNTTQAKFMAAPSRVIEDEETIDSSGRRWTQDELNAGRVSESNLQLNVPGAMLDADTTLKRFADGTPVPTVTMFEDKVVARDGVPLKSAGTSECWMPDAAVDEFASDGLRGVYVHDRGLFDARRPLDGGDE